MGESLDRFGIKMLHPTAEVGRVWTSSWDNGQSRSFTSGARDQYDSEFVARGSGTEIHIDGNGIARLSGTQPRMYVYEQDRTWDNVEVTFYAKRIRETSSPGARGFTVGARSEHQAATDLLPCSGFAYYGRMLYNGHINFEKELAHPPAPPPPIPVPRPGYSHIRPEANLRAEWGTANGEIPVRRWIGFKFVVRNFDQGSKVRLSLYRDMEEGEEGGVWEQLLHEADGGDWPVAPIPECSFSPTQVLNMPASSVFIRNTGISAADYSKFSIREIDPE